ncbi:sulfate permease [Wolfiporia cocos MD-104 SS10]|uniref:Sulfate permease n=1 Tax=Wolfiporia cocos (strain MD-104) TaxID=742152 RepID=A0A2H3JKV4_WOLCO|nr:sulfate permease [Wolfiporia cocos MD-104 SS10]
MIPEAKNAVKRIVGYPEEPIPVVTVGQWAHSLSKDPGRGAINYVKGLFPITGWISRYNLGWLTGDLIAGLTVGIVAVPQSMSYAQACIATLPVQYGLYSTFVGTLVYSLFATSKDVNIGPVAVMSLTVSQIISYVNQHYPDRWSSPEIATTIAFICGFIVLALGLLRLGWIVEFIPAPAVSGYMTGSAINIVSGQVPGLMGLTGFDTRAATYKVIINSLKHLPKTQLDAAFGLTGLASLYMIRMTCDYMIRRFPRRQRIFFFLSVFRNAFVIVILTIASWLYCRHRKSHSGKYPIKVLGTVPRGFQDMGAPTIDADLISALAPQLPVATIILVLEHIAISRSFGRVNNYKINPNQELIAIGVTNTIGTLFGAYPATGSFSRSALSSKSGVRTPAAGLVSSVVVLVALYGLTPAFYWIPSAALSAVIIHAVADLVASPRQVYSYWRVSPIEFVIWFAAVLVTVFSTIEDGIYTAICTSLALLLVRVARPRGYFLGRVKVQANPKSSDGARDVFVPLTPKGTLMNPGIKVTPPAPGIVVYRFEESLLYPNSHLFNSGIVDYVKENTRRGKDFSNVSVRDRPWNDPGPRPGQDLNIENLNKPILHAIVLDFSGISHIDTTAVQALIDTRIEVDRWADRPVEFHFATILSPWIRRALIAGGFGVGTPASSIPTEIASVVPYREGRSLPGFPEPVDLESVLPTSVTEEPRIEVEETAPVNLEDTPFFHFDLASAVQAAESGLSRMEPVSRSSLSKDDIKQIDQASSSEC